MTNTESMVEILRDIADGMRDLLNSTLKFDDFEHVTNKSWGEATTALRSMDEAVKLLETIAYIDEDSWIHNNGGIDALPELPHSSMHKYSNSFGNRCYWQNVAIQRWVHNEGDSHTGVPDNRWDLDFDIIETVETTETKTTKKTTKKRNGKKVSITDLMEK